MAVRTTVEEVKKIIHTTLVDDDISSFISTASMQVDEKLDGQGMSDDRLIEIEKYLTCHFIASTKDRPPIEEKVGDVTVKYLTNSKLYAEGLRSTRYGQLVVQLDTTGIMAKQARKKAIFKSL